MIQINPLKSYIDGGVRAAITTPPSASLVFDLPGKAIWVKGVKLKGTDHTYTFNHDNYTTLINTPDKNNPESEDIKIGVNITTLKKVIDTTYNGGTLALLQEGLNTEERTWLAKILHNYINNVLPITKNIKINNINYAIYTTEKTLPLFYAPTSLGTSGQILSCTSSGLSWVNLIQNTDYRVSLSAATNNNDYRIILKQEPNNNPETSFVRFSEYLTFNPSTKTLKINNVKVITNSNIYVGATSTTNAITGLVPAATSAQYNYFLRGDGTWAIPSNTWRPVKVEGTEKLGSNALDLSAGNGISIIYNSDTKKIVITNTKPDVNHNTDRTGIKLATVSGTKKTDSTLILANSVTGLNIQGGTNKFLIGDGTNYIEVPVISSVSNKDATIGTALTTIATVAGVDIKAKIASYSLSNHTHSVKINGSTKTIAASGAVDLGNYLPLSGGTMNGTAWIVWPDSGNWSNSNSGVTFPVIRGGLHWLGLSDWIKLFSEETSNDNLNLVLQFGDDNSNGLSIRNTSNVQTSHISSSGVITTKTFKGNLDWSYITNKPSSYTPSAHTHAWNSLTHSSTTENQAILTNGSVNGWKLYTLNISGWNNAANNAHSHSNKSVLDGITSTLVSNWNTAYNFVNTITGTDTDKVINKWDEIVNFLAGISEDDKLNTLLNSKLSVYELANNTNIGAIKNNGIYYSTSDASSGTLTNSPFNTGFALINMTSYDGGDDLRRSRLAFNAYGEIKVSDDRDLANTAETWYNVLTSKNSGISGSTIKLNGTSITVYSSSTADGRYVKKSGDTMSGALTIDTTSFGTLVLKRNDDTNGASIQFRGKSNVYGYIGLNNSAKDKLFLRWNSDTSKTYTILDTSSTYVSSGKGIINGTTITQVDNAINSTNSTNARKLVNWYSTRPTSLNTQFGDGSLRIFYATSSTTEGKPAEDSPILHLAWDNTGGWDTQLAVHTRSGKVSTRAQNKGTWQSWKTLAFTTDIPSSLKNPYALTISLNGTSLGAYDGSAAKNINITPSSIGAAISGHNHDGRYVRYYAVTTLDCNNLAVGLTAAGVSATNAAHTNHSAFLYISDVGTPFQIQIPDSNVPYIYKRYYSSGTWSGWFKLNAGYADSAGSVAWNNVTGKPSSYTPSAHTHTVFNNNLMIKGTNGVSDSASIHLGIGDSDTGFKWISDGKCLIYANNIAVGEWTSGGMNWFKNPTVNGNKVWNAGNDGGGSGLDADLLDGVHLNGIFTNLANNENNVQLTIGGVTKALTINYAKNADTIDGAHLSDIKNWSDRTASAYWKAGWYKVASAQTATNTEAFLTLDVNAAQSNGHATLFIRKRADSKPYFICTHNNNLNLADFRLYYNGMSMVLYARVPNDWNGRVFRIISEGREGRYDHIWTLYSNISSTDPNAISAEGENPYINPTYSGRVDWSNSSDKATRLLTSRTLWGRPFDGTANVSGSLSNTGTITPSAAGTYDIGSSSLDFRYGYFQWIGAKANTNLRLAAGNGDNQIVLHTNGNVGIGTNAPAYKLHVTGDIYTTTGFKKNGSSDSYVLLGGGGHKLISDFSTSAQGVGTIISISKSLTPTTSWIDTGIKTDSATFPGGNGSYIVQISIPSSSGTDGWGDLYTGYFSLYTGTNSSTEDEILLHGASHALLKRIYLKTKATANTDGTMHFYIASEKAFSAARTINFKFRKLI